MANDLINYEKKMQELAKKAASVEVVTEGHFITCPGGVLKFGDIDFPGNQMAVIILDAIHEHTYYDTTFSEDKKTVPKCYAFGYNPKEMVPNDELYESDYFVPQIEQDGDKSCYTCPMFQWGSGRNKSKACNVRRRLAVIPAGRFVKGAKRGEYDLDMFDDPEHFKDAEAALFKLPVTSVKNWSKYVQMLADQYNRPPFGVFTHIYLEPDPKTVFSVHFEVIDKVPDDMLETIMRRHGEASKIIGRPYTEPYSDKDDAKAF